MLLQRKNSQSVDNYSFSTMPRNAFKAPKNKRSPAKPETESYTSTAKKRRTKDDFYTFCTIVLSYTQYESLKRDELRQQNNISPVGSGGSAADSYSSDSTASLSSGSLQECIQENLPENLPIDRVQQQQDSAATTTTTTTTPPTTSNNRLSEREITQQQTPKQQFLKQQTPKHQQLLLKQHQQLLKQQHSKNQLLKQQQQLPTQSVQPKQQLVPKQQTKQQTKPQQQQQPTLLQPTTLLPPVPSSLPQQQNTSRVDGILHRNVKPELSISSIQQYPPQQKQKLHQQVLVDDEAYQSQLENIQLQQREECDPCEHRLKTHIKNEEDNKNDTEEVTTSIIVQDCIPPVKEEEEEDFEDDDIIEDRKNMHYCKLDNAESNTDSLPDSCGDSIHSNSSSPDAIESDDESWDLITCHCLKPYAGRPMIECSECSTWIHLSCAKIRKSNIPETFVCQQCREAKFTTRKSNRIRTESKRISI